MKLNKYRVVVRNDNVNSFDHVIETFIRELGMPEVTAFSHTVRIDKLGASVISICHRELAETYLKRLHDNGLKVTLVRRGK